MLDLGVCICLSYCYYRSDRRTGGRFSNIGLKKVDLSFRKPASQPANHTTGTVQILARYRTVATANHQPLSLLPKLQKGSISYCTSTVQKIDTANNHRHSTFPSQPMIDNVNQSRKWGKKKKKKRKKKSKPC